MAPAGPGATCFGHALIAVVAVWTTEQFTRARDQITGLFFSLDMWYTICSDSIFALALTKGVA
jgi:hypothetical protein